MIIFSLLILSLLRVQSDPYYHTSVEILNCGDGQTISGATKPSGKIQCAGTTGQFKLGTKNEVIIHSVTYEALKDVTTTNLCKNTASNDYEIKFEVTSPKMKNIIYSDNGEHKAILTGTDNACYTSLIVADEVLKKGYLHVTTISCIPETIAKKLKDSTEVKKTSKFHKAGTNICFLAPMLTENLETEIELNNAKYKLIVSAYPKKECPVCESTSTSKPQEAPKKSS